ETESFAIYREEENFSRAVGFLPIDTPKFCIRNFFARPFFQDENSICFKQFGQRFVCQKFIRERFTGFHFVVRRIGKNYLKFLTERWGVLQKRENFLLTNAPRQFDFCQIFFDRIGRLSILLNEKSVGSAATERLDPERAG